MNKLATVSALAALAMGGQALADDLSYHYVDAGLILGDSPGGNDGKGIGVAGSVDLPQLYRNATGIGGIRYIDFDFGNLLQASAGLGFHWPIASVVDFNGGLSLGLNKFSGGDTDLGFILNAGVRATPFQPEWELDGGLRHTDIGLYEDTSIVLGARYAFRPGMSAGIELDSGDIDFWTLSLRWEM